MERFIVPAMLQVENQDVFNSLPPKSRQVTCALQSQMTPPNGVFQKIQYYFVSKSSQFDTSRRPILSKTSALVAFDAADLFLLFQEAQNRIQLVIDEKFADLCPEIIRCIIEATDIVTNRIFGDALKTDVLLEARNRERFVRIQCYCSCTNKRE